MTRKIVSHLRSIAGQISASKEVQFAAYEGADHIEKLEAALHRVGNWRSAGGMDINEVTDWKKDIEPLLRDEKTKEELVTDLRTEATLLVRIISSGRLHLNADAVNRVTNILEALKEAS